MSMRPLWVTLATASLSEAACIKTWPPSVTMTPLWAFVTAVLIAAGVTSKRTRLLMRTLTFAGVVVCVGAAAGKVTVSAAAKTTSPWGAVILPSLVTEAPTKATKPPDCVWIVPWLTTCAVLPLRWYLYTLAAKSCSLRAKVLAVKLLAFTEPSLPKAMPLGLSRITWPLAESLPKIWLGSLPTTRLSMTALALGCTMLTLALLPILKLCQLTLALSVVCSNAIWLPLELTATEPLLTLPPWGRAVLLIFGSVDCADVTPIDRHAKATVANPKRNAPTKPSAKLVITAREACPLADFPAADACSPTATSIPRRLEKITL